MSRISITTSGSLAWREHKRHKALRNVVQSFIKEEVDRPNVVCVDSKYSKVVFSNEKDNVTKIHSDKVLQNDLPSPALRVSHGCEATASSYFYRKIIDRNDNAKKLIDNSRKLIDNATIPNYEVQDLSIWMSEEWDCCDEFSDEGRNLSQVRLG